MRESWQGRWFVCADPERSLFASVSSKTRIGTQQRISHSDVQCCTQCCQFVPPTVSYFAMLFFDISWGVFNRSCDNLCQSSFIHRLCDSNKPLRNGLVRLRTNFWKIPILNMKHSDVIENYLLKTFHAFKMNVFRTYEKYFQKLQISQNWCEIVSKIIGKWSQIFSFIKNDLRLLRKMTGQKIFKIFLTLCPNLKSPN